MKKICFIILTFISYTYSCYPFFNFFSDNPAYIATRQHQEMLIPFSTFELHVDNSLLSFKDVEIFDKDRVLSSSDKRLLTKSDLDIFVDISADLIQYGYHNWEFSFSIHTYMQANVLDKNLSKIIFYGNELDKNYKLYNGKNSFCISFTKNRLSYGHPEPVLIQDIPLFFGANINTYSSVFYGKVVESSQNFITASDSIYYNHRLQFMYTDSNSTGKLNTTLGLGFGVKANLPKGAVYLHVDDIFASLYYNDLAKSLYEQTYIDSLLYLTKYYQPFSDSYENDTLRVSTKKHSLSSTIVVGGEYPIVDDVTASVKISYCKYRYQNGFSLGVSYSKIEWLPLMFVYGSTNNSYYELRTGLDLPSFQLLIAPVYYNGFFHRTKGLGIKIGMKYLF